MGVGVHRPSVYINSHLFSENQQATSKIKQINKQNKS